MWERLCACVCVRSFVKETSKISCKYFIPCGDRLMYLFDSTGEENGTKGNFHAGWGRKRTSHRSVQKIAYLPRAFAFRDILGTKK